MISKIRKYWPLSRWPMCLLGAWTVMLSAWISQSRLYLDPRIFFVALGMAILIAGTMINNDWSDQDIDCKKGKLIKNLRWNEGIEVSCAGVFIIHLGLPLRLNSGEQLLYVIGFGLAYWLLIAHSLNKKRWTFIPPLVVAFWAIMPVFAGAHTAGSIMPVHWLLAGFIFFIIMSREIIKDIEDIEYDMGIRPTIPIELGIATTTKISTITILIAIIIAFYLMKIDHNRIFTIVTGFSSILLAMVIYMIHCRKNNFKSPSIPATLMAISLWLELVACHLLI